MPRQIARAAYAHMDGPTLGDRVPLADTEPLIEVEADRTICGEEVKSGGEKVTRDRTGQSRRTREQGAVDRVIANALILENWEADIGIRDGRIAGSGKAGNPHTQPGVAPGTYGVRADGALLTCEQASVLPLAQRYLLY